MSLYTAVIAGGIVGSLMRWLRKSASTGAGRR